MEKVDLDALGCSMLRLTEWRLARLKRAVASLVCTHLSRDLSNQKAGSPIKGLEHFPDNFLPVVQHMHRCAEHLCIYKYVRVPAVHKPFHFISFHSRASGREEL